MNRAVLVMGLVLGAGCWEHQRPFLGIEDNEAFTVPAPLKDRCTRYPPGSPNNASCQQMKETAFEWTRHLSVGDQFCMDSPFGEDYSGTCKARGALVDSGPNWFTIEIRDAHSDSRWVQYNERRVRYETGALIDCYLKEKGFE